MSKKEYLPINWTNGVKLSENYFRKNHYNLIETIKDYSKIYNKKFSYGILEAIDSQIKALSVDVISNSSESITVELKSCNAITTEGYHILYYPEIYGMEYPTATIKKEDIEAEERINQTYYLIVSVNPYKSIPAGIPDPDVIPLHHPYALPEIKLNIFSNKQINKSFINEYHLIIGKIKYEGDLFLLEDNYIPPITRNAHDKRMLGFCTQLPQKLIQMKDYVMQIFKKNKDNPKASHFAQNTFKVCDSIIEFYTQNIFYFTNIIDEDPPIFLVDKISQLANKLSLSLNLINEKEREMLLQYYYEWTELEPSKFIGILSSVINIQYEHSEINNSLVKINNLIETLLLLFRKMSDLEYIGQRKDNIVISKDSEKIKKVSNKPKWHIID